MQRTIPAMFLAALLAGACDPAQSDEEAAALAADTAAEDAQTIFYAGERFTIDDLGEAPPYLVTLANGEVHGFDEEVEAERFVDLRSGPRDLAAAYGPLAAPSQINFWANTGWAQGNPGIAWPIPGEIEYLGGIYDWNDRISSTYNQSSYWVVLCEHAGFGGNKYWLEPGAIRDDLRKVDWNDRVSSYYTD
ncbi:peptidase inhibitor family I36 protein [Nannocystis radixulma]|uniref:Uncharacterized protein n=1 Tax=Nannocystis radixulma TaxID=2995305 RepID=A0ABT5B459_9BACT|nr:peptidase inhibitor family I36 protein [Nannocystis radixulma]MDC0668877.1 hypothetical protein [Nannocystis radixulma]